MSVCIVQAALVKIEEDVTEEFNVRRDKYEDQMKDLELQLEAILRELRGSADMETLEQNLAETHRMVGEASLIEQAHRDFNRDMVSISSSLMPKLSAGLADYQQQFAQRFGISLLPEPVAGAALSAADVLARELGNNVQSIAGTKYNAIQDVPTLANTILATATEEEREAAASAAAKAEAAAKARAEAEASGQPLPPDEPVVEKPAIDPEDEGLSEEERFGIIDTDAVACLEILKWDQGIVEKAAETLRQSFIDQWERVKQQWKETAEALNGTRQSDLAREVNQVLRAHRPRIRRVESDIYEKRAVEIVANRGKYERHAQRVSGVTYANNASFHETKAAIETTLEAYVEDVKQCQVKLNADGIHSSSVLEALQKRVKEAQLITTQETAKRIEGLQKICTELQSKSTSAEKGFVESCKLISEEDLNKAAKLLNPNAQGNTQTAASPKAGTSKAADASAAAAELTRATSAGISGTYNPDEVAFYAENAAAITTQITAVLEEREGQIKALQVSYFSLPPPLSLCVSVPVSVSVSVSLCPSVSDRMCYLSYSLCMPFLYHFV
jgi:hypothetical protein